MDNDPSPLARLVQHIERENCLDNYHLVNRPVIVPTANANLHFALPRPVHHDPFTSIVEAGRPRVAGVAGPHGHEIKEDDEW